jgi:hypothetical protein
MSEAVEKAKKMIQESKNRELLDTARNYVDKFCNMFGKDTKEALELKAILNDKDKSITIPTFNWDILKFEAFCTASSTWCKILCIDIENNNIILSDRAMRTYQILSDTSFRSIVV